MAKFTGANKQQQTELKRLHAKKKSAEDAAKITSIELSCVKSFYESFEPKKAAETKTTK